jgi:hypothetical protein
MEQTGGVDGYHRLASLLTSHHLAVDVLELSVAIRMRCTFPRLAIGLKAVARFLQKVGDRAVRHGMALMLKFLSQLAGALAGPTQRRLRVTSSRRIDQRIQGPLQPGVSLRQRLTPAAGSADRVAWVKPTRK